MYLSSTKLMFSLFHLSLLSHALPLTPRFAAERPAVRRRAAYSVVAVDGGPGATSSISDQPGVVTILHTSDHIQTVTPTVTLPPSTQTIISTAVISETEPPTTIATSIVQEHTVTLAPSSMPSSIPTTIPIQSTTYAIPAIVNPAEKSSLPVATHSTTLDHTSSFSMQPSSTVSPSTSAFANSTSSPSPSPPSIALPTAIPAEAAPLPAGLAPPSSPVAATPSTQSSTTLTTESTTTQPPSSETATSSPEASSYAFSKPSPQPASYAMTTLSGLPSATSKTYDDGMWHTTWRQSWNATLTGSGSYATAASTGTAYNLWKES